MRHTGRTPVHRLRSGGMPVLPKQSTLESTVRLSVAVSPSIADRSALPARNILSTNPSPLTERACVDPEPAPPDLVVLFQPVTSHWRSASDAPRRDSFGQSPLSHTGIPFFVSRQARQLGTCRSGCGQAIVVRSAHNSAHLSSDSKHSPAPSAPKGGVICSVFVGDQALTQPPATGAPRSD